jgi:nucleoside-diphosphate-sugar epimerase
MRVFVTGATGFIGSAIVRELLAAGHQVLGLARTDAAAAKIAAAGAEVHRGALEDLDSLRSGATASDGVIHTASASVSDSDPVKIVQMGLHAIETLGAALAGSDRPFVVTSAIALLSPGRLVTEEDAPSPDSAMGTFGTALEEAALSLVSHNVRVSVVRLPFSVHGEDDHGFVPALINVAHGRGVSAYPGNGSNRWPAVHRLDAAHLYRLTLENAKAGSRLHAVSDEGVPVRDIAVIIGRRLNIPVVTLPVEEANGHFDWIGHFFSMDYLASSTFTRERLGWHPVQPALLADLNQDYYFKNEA